MISEQKPIEIELSNRFIKFYKSLLESDNPIVSYMAKLQSQNCRTILGQNIRHIIINNNLSWYEFESNTTNVINKKLYEYYMDSVHTETFIDAKIKRDIILRDETFNDCFLTEDQSLFFNFLCTS